jgi:hypothetical protein
MGTAILFTPKGSLAEERNGRARRGIEMTNIKMERMALSTRIIFLEKTA